jgi:small subunit ribosomal protein S17
MAKKKNEEEAEQTPVADDAGAEEPPAEAQSEAEVEADAFADEPVAEAPAEDPAAEEEPADEPVAAEEPLAEEEPAEETVADAEPEPEAEAEPKPVPAAKATPKKAAKPKPKQAAKPKAKKSARAEGTARERKPVVRLPKPERVRGGRKERRGTVVSSAMDKTIVVRVETVKPHPRYKKVMRRSTKFHAHDEGNVAKPGDVVRIVATRPLSKTKSWRLVEVVEAAK